MTSITITTRSSHADYDTVGDARQALTKGYPTQPSVEEVLEATSGEGLLVAFASLTHRIHAARRPGVRDTDPMLVDLYAQRDAVQAEVLRRMGDA